MQPNDNAAVPVGFGKLLMRPPDAVQHRFKPGDLAVRVVLVRWVERHRLRRPTEDIVADFQMPQLLAAVVPEALSGQGIVAGVKNQEIAILHAEGVVKVGVEFEKVVIEPTHVAFNTNESGDLFSQRVASPVFDEKPQQLHKEEKEDDQSDGYSHRVKGETTREKVLKDAPRPLWPGYSNHAARHGQRTTNSPEKKLSEVFPGQSQSTSPEPVPANLCPSQEGAHHEAPPTPH